MSKKVEINVGLLGGLNLFLEKLFFYLMGGGHISNRKARKNETHF